MPKATFEFVTLKSGRQVGDTSGYEALENGEIIRNFDSAEVRAWIGSALRGEVEIGPISDPRRTRVQRITVVLEEVTGAGGEDIQNG